MPAHQGTVGHSIAMVEAEGDRRESGTRSRRKQRCKWKRCKWKMKWKHKQSEVERSGSDSGRNQKWKGRML